MTSPGGYSAGAAYLDVIPSFDGVQQAIKREMRKMEQALGKTVGNELGKELEDRIPRSVDKALDTSKAKAAKAGKDAGDEYAGRFADGFKKAMTGVQREFKGIKLDAKFDDDALQKKFRSLKGDIERLSKFKIGANMDAGPAFREMAKVETKLRELQDVSIDLNLRNNLGAVASEFEAFRKRVEKDAKFEVEPDFKYERQLGLFETAVRKRIRAAMENFPPVEFDADISPAQEKLMRLRQEMIELHDKQIGIDLTGAEASAEVERLRVALATLANDKDIDIQVRADAAGAAAELLAIRKVAELVDKTKIDIDVDIEENGVRQKLAAIRNAMINTGNGGQEGANAFRAFNGVILTASTLLPAVVPLLGSLAGGLALIGPMGVAAAGGLTMGILAFQGVGDAVKAMGEVENDRAKDATANARKIRTASESVRDAQQAVERAETSGARSIASANRAVSDARENAADVARDSARRVADAVDTQKDAERDLARAQAEVLRAQEDVTRARKEAREELEDLTLSVRGGALAERDAVLGLKEAREELEAGRANGTTGDELERLILGYDQAVFRLDEIRERNGDLNEQQAEWARTGVEGSARVVAAQDGVVRAREGVATAEERVQDAVQAVADAVAEGQRAQRDASRAITDAVRAQQEAQADAADSIASANSNLTQAQAAYRDAIFETGELGSASMQKLNEAMANLSPAGRDFARYIHSIRDEARGLRDLAQAGILPGVEDAINSILTRNGPELRRFIGEMSFTLGDIFRRTGEMFTNSQWDAIFEVLGETAPTMLRQLGDIGMNSFTVLGELFRGLAPYAVEFGDALVDMTENAADWMQSFVDGKQFQSIMDWLFTNGPIVWDTMVDIGRAILSIMEALAPFGMVVIRLLDLVAEFIADMDPQILGGIAFAFLGMLASFQLAMGAVSLSVLAIDGAMGALTGWILVIGAAVTALTILYTQSESFRDIVNSIIDVLGFVLTPFIELAELLLEHIEIIGWMVAAWAGMKAIQLLTPIVSSFFETIALKALYARDAFIQGEAGVGRMTTAMGGLRGAGTRILDMLGGPWGVGMAVAGIGVGLLVQGLQKATEQGQEWAEQLRDGGKAAVEAKREMDELRKSVAGTFIDDDGSANWGGAIWQGIKTGLGQGGELGAQAKALNEAAEASRNYWNSLSPIEQAQAKVSEWTNTLSYRMEHLGKNAGDTQIAQERLDYWTRQLEGAQTDLDEAVSGVNEELLRQQEHSIALAEADIAFKQSTDQLAQAHQAVADAAEKGAEGTDELRAAEERLVNQSLSTAQAAGRVAEARHSDAEGAERQQWANAAILDNLMQQEAQYGALPPRLQALKDELYNTVPASYLLTTQMENLALTVTNIPDGKTIHIDDAGTSAAQLQTLRDLGYVVTQLPNGDYEVVAQTEDAELALQELTRDRTIKVSTEVSNAVSAAGKAAAGALGRFTPKGFGWATGGAIRGPGTGTSDSIPAWLSNGEYVVKADSVSKYGLGMLDMINAGRFAEGGVVWSRAPKFAAGGGVTSANWGGTISMSGSDPSPLSAFWFEAIAQIQAAASHGSAVVSQLFANMRDSAVGSTASLKDGVKGYFDPLMGDLASGAEGMRTKTKGSFDLLRYDSEGTFGGLSGGVRSIWDYMRGDLFAKTDDLVNRTGLRFGDMRLQTEGTTEGMSGGVRSIWDWMRGAVGGFTDQLVDHTGRRFGDMRSGVAGATQGAVDDVNGRWGQLGGIMAGPVDFVIGDVLNKGLFSAYNSIIQQLGLPKQWIVKDASPVARRIAGGATINSLRLASGGRVPGWSPHDKADNVPAMLTAGEYVHPVDAVRYYGPDLMEAIRKRRIPREVLDGTQHLASGGLVYQQLFSAVKSRFPRARLNDGYRPGARDMHGRGQAVDLGEMGFSGGSGRPYLAAMNRDLYDRAGRFIAELIYTGSGDDRPDLKNGRPLNYGPATNAQHVHHVHLGVNDLAGFLNAFGAGTGGAFDDGSGGGMALPSWAALYSDAGAVKKKLQESVLGVMKLPAMLNTTGQLPAILGGVANKGVERMWGKIAPTVESMFAGLASQLAGATAAPLSVQGPVVDIVRAAADRYGWGSGNEWNALSRLIQKESSWNPRAQNPTSTAYGLFQFLNSTWAGTGYAKSADPNVQAAAGLKYVQSRYGSPSAALAFHNKNNWYSEGGEVQPNSEAPTLYDSGGWLPPGITTVLNATNRPEPVLTGQAWDELVASRGPAEGGDVIGELHLHQVQADLSEAIGEVNHWAKAYDNGGRYAGAGTGS